MLVYNKDNDIGTLRKGAINLVKCITGRKGSGKTKKMLHMANEKVDSGSGSIVFIDKDHSLMYDLKYQIRVVCMEEFDQITNIDEYIGFLYGIISSDHDIEVIFIDGILRLKDVTVSDFQEFLPRLKAISEQHELDFVVSISADLEELGSAVEGCELID